MENEVLAPLAGKVWKLIAKVGDDIEEDDEVVIIEALKMETPVYSPCDGKISAIKVKEGDEVDEDQVMVLITS